MSPLHLNILILLVAPRDYGERLGELLTKLRVSGHRGLTVPELEKTLRDLADKSFVTPFDSPLSGTRWRITALGKSALAEEGLG